MSDSAFNQVLWIIGVVGFSLIMMIRAWRDK